MPKLIRTLPSGDEFAYPIYRFTVTLSDKQHSVSGTEMQEFSLNQRQLAEALQKFTDTNLDAQRHSARGDYTHRQLIERGELTLVETGAEYARHETWTCRWFNHMTFNDHLSDADLRTSFNDYVGRYEHMARLAAVDIIELGKEYICLMGAEERWRWKDPCHCEHCKELGWTHIDH